MGNTPEFKDQLKAMDGLEKALTIAEKQRIEREEKEKREKAPLWTIPITDITSDFVEIYRTVHEAFAGEIDVHEIVSKGGRGSIKSNFWGDLAYETIRQDPQAHIVYTRRYKVDLRGSVYNQFMKTVIRYNDLDNWDFKQSPMCAVYKPTGQTVMCLEPFCTFKESFTKPLDRDIVIIAVANSCLWLIPALFHILIHEIVLGFWRIKYLNI